jgi:hypothetical protein
VRRRPQTPVLGAVALAFLALVVAGGVAVPEAEAAKPCWRLLINDWYDGRIDRSYPVSCYREAIKNLPPDVKTYSSAQDDLERALQNAIRQNGGQAPRVVPPAQGGRTVDPSDPDEEATGATGGGSSGGSDGGGGSPQGDDGVLSAFEPANADSIPVPLLVLAGVAMLLLAAAATGFVAKRIQERRVPIAPAAPGPGDGPTPPQPPE